MNDVRSSAADAGPADAQGRAWERTLLEQGTTRRRCPRCGRAVHRKHFARARLRRRWLCPECGTMLRCAPAPIIGGRAIGVTVVAAVLLVAILSGTTAALSLVLPALVILGLAWLARNRLQSVQVDPARAGLYCRGCRYDLAGSLRSGSTRCPECGDAAPPRALDVLGAVELDSST